MYTAHFNRPATLQVLRLESGLFQMNSKSPKTPSQPKAKPYQAKEESRRPFEATRGKGHPDEMKICGLNACLRLYKVRAEDIIRVYVVENRLESCADLIKSCARRRKAYHVVSAADMDKISGSTHHEGVCILAKRRTAESWDQYLNWLENNPDAASLALILEDVENPHNLGAIMRSAAHFGCKHIILANEKSYKPPAAVLRTAEGGGEVVHLICAPQIRVIATELRHRNVSVLGTGMQGRIKLYSKGASGQLPGRVAIILGNEAKGLTPEAKKAADGLIFIPGTGEVDSLNVSVASALILGEYYRQHSING
jgi:RNA methyltransferase, TrmH family